MPIEVQMTKDHDPGLYDSDTGDDLVAERVVDITADCPSGRRTVLLFTRAKRGRIVQITHPWDGEVYFGSHTHFFVDELGREMSRPEGDDILGLWADLCGLSKADLAQKIVELAPQ